MRVGDIYIWHSYPRQKDGEIKDRWFLFLGEVRNVPFDDDPSIYVVSPTATTRLEYYEQGAHREKHLYFCFRKDSGFGFEKDCILDVTLPPEHWPKRIFLDFESKGLIEKKGELPKDILEKIYNKILLSSAYSYIEKENIKRNLNQELGLTGLRKPSRRRRKR